MKIAIAQLNYTVGDIDGNTSKIIDSITRAKGLGADLVLFAGGGRSGTPAFDLLRKHPHLELCEDALVQIASCQRRHRGDRGAPILTAEGARSSARADPGPQKSCALRRQEVHHGPVVEMTGRLLIRKGAL